MKNEFDYLNDVTVDFSIYEETELTEKELESMKNLIRPNKKLKFGRVCAVAACAVLIAAFTQTALAKEFAAKIIKSISTGHNSFYQVDGAEVPNELLGLLFDKDGNDAAANAFRAEELYDKDGNKITDVEEFLRDAGVLADTATEKVHVSTRNENSGILEQTKEAGWSVLMADEFDKLNDVLDFAPALPSMLPEGFSPYFAAYFDNDGKYLFLYYTNPNGEYISVHQRLLNEETAFSSGTDGEMRETKVNGHKAVLLNGQSIDWEDGDISIGISSRGLIGEKELMQMAESLQR